MSEVLNTEEATLERQKSLPQGPATWTRPSRRTAQELPGARKAAIFCVAIGEETASEVFRHLDEDEVQAVSRELAALHRVPSEVTEEVIEEFHQLLIAQSYV